MLIPKSPCHDGTARLLLHLYKNIQEYTRIYTRKNHQKTRCFIDKVQESSKQPFVLLVDLWSCSFLLGIHSTSGGGGRQNLAGEAFGTN